MVNYANTFKTQQIVNNFQTYELYLLHNSIFSYSLEIRKYICKGVRIKIYFNFIY